jgi:hypothetical protein
LIGSKVPLDGAIMYSNGWDAKNDVDYFRYNFFGIYNFALAISQRSLHLNQSLPALKEHLDKEKHEKMVKDV